MVRTAAKVTNMVTSLHDATIRYLLRESGTKGSTDAPTVIILVPPLARSLRTKQGSLTRGSRRLHNVLAHDAFIKKLVAATSEYPTTHVRTDCCEDWTRSVSGCFLYPPG